MIRAHLVGNLHSDPGERIANNGNPFAIARMSVPQHDGDRFLCSLIACDDRAVKRLMQMKAGTSVSVAGSLKVGTWTTNDGTVRPSLDLVADEIAGTTLRPRKRPGKSVAADAGINWLDARC